MFQLHGDLRDYAWGTNGLDTIITQVKKISIYKKLKKYFIYWILHFIHD